MVLGSREVVEHFTRRVNAKSPEIQNMLQFLEKTTMPQTKYLNSVRLWLRTGNAPPL